MNALRTRARQVWSVGLGLGLVLLLAGCGADPGAETVQTDANGYVCMKCGAKFYTDRRHYIEMKCPKCAQESIADVVGYWCEKDRHLTLRPHVTGVPDSATCEVCQAPLKNALVSPREKDLKIWGAVEAPREFQRAAPGQ